MRRDVLAGSVTMLWTSPVAVIYRGQLRLAGARRLDSVFPDTGLVCPRSCSLSLKRSWLNHFYMYIYSTLILLKKSWHNQRKRKLVYSEIGFISKVESAPVCVCFARLCIPPWFRLTVCWTVDLGVLVILLFPACETSWGSRIRSLNYILRYITLHKTFIALHKIFSELGCTVFTSLCRYPSVQAAGIIR